MPSSSTDFTLTLPAMDSDLMPEWLYEPGPEIPLSQEDVRRLYRDSTCTDDSLSLGLRSLRAPSPAELQSLWDDSDSDSGSDDEDEDDEQYDDDDENVYVSDADTASTSATLHEAARSPIRSPSEPSEPASKQQPPSPPSPPSLRRHSSDTLRLYAYSSADPQMVACLDAIVDEALLCNPFSVYADVCYVAAVKREPQNGVSRGSSELERVTEEEEEHEEVAEADPESDSSDDDDEPELVSPVQAGTAPKWSSGVYLGNEPSEALTAISLPPVYHAVDTKVRCFSPEPAAAAEVAYLFLRTQYPVDPKDSVAAFPTHVVTRESSGRSSVRDIIRGFGIGRRDRVSLSTPA
ncbi:hypothetical protein EIP91_007766 [Steccherinum ochraceum]|uniref:Uncharacterized protein n=1 Tax=Steccherinum ochraceum TaxID=92696 RepID=A0A4R0RUJ4_9APHY|nr:hypothetical protein EIP91_007766 [Steccherinum ochraceum]